MVEQAIAAHPFAHSGFIERVGHAVFDHARTYAPLYVVATSTFDDDAVNASLL
jgi:hypothetical protein